MTLQDIQERLRDPIYGIDMSKRMEIADLLDAQEPRIKTLEEALREIAKGMRGGQVMYASECWAIAREALKP